MDVKKFFIGIVIGSILVTAVILLLSPASFKRKWKDTTTDLMGGVQRTATVYSNDGDVIAVYEGKIDISDDGNYETQLLIDGNRRVSIIGGITIIEEK